MAKEQGDRYELGILFRAWIISGLNQGQELVADVQLVEQQRDQATRPREVACLFDELAKD